jgi:hypothetical protein
VVEGNVCGSGDGVTATGTITGTATRTAGGGGGGGGATPTACATVASIVSECANGDDEYLSEPLDVQAGCYCYMTNGKTVSWVPEQFGGAASQCAAWAQTADPEDYTLYSALARVCTVAGDFLGDGSSVTTMADASGGRQTAAVATSTSSPLAAQTGFAATATGASPAATTSSKPSAAGALAVQKSLAFGVAVAVMGLFFA